MNLFWLDENLGPIGGAGLKVIRYQGTTQADRLQAFRLEEKTMHPDRKEGFSTNSLQPTASIT